MVSRKATGALSRNNLLPDQALHLHYIGIGLAPLETAKDGHAVREPGDAHGFRAVLHDQGFAEGSNGRVGRYGIEKAFVER